MVEVWCSFFFFNDTATTEIYTLSLHDALPIWLLLPLHRGDPPRDRGGGSAAVQVVRRSCISPGHPGGLDRKSTRLNSSHANISYAVFCLKKKKKITMCAL